MLKTMVLTLNVLIFLLSGAVAQAGKKPERKDPPCDPELIKAVRSADQNRAEMEEAMQKYMAGERHGWNDEQFCKWLEDRYNGDTEARFGECLTCQGRPEKKGDGADVDAHRDVTKEVTLKIQVDNPGSPERYKHRHRDDDEDYDRPPRGERNADNGMGMMMIMMMFSRMNNQNQFQPSYFPQPQWGPRLGSMAPPMVPGRQGPLRMMPYPGPGGGGGFPSFAGPVGSSAPWQAPFLGGSGGPSYSPGLLLGGYSGGGGQIAPPVAPLDNQFSSPYSVWGPRR